ncbi:TPA: hypothetical protein MYS77_004415 [Klebsiella aerogenes]|nr:hypothetical protein [Klebsiella aerogenes]HCB2864851.1 hypothetical protein [Klebsiella aerogenes]HCB2880477.1 hypothetical protein [Klebsiella aerogenes]HCM1811916.1 hypothetical protein [Klebsiella aerogenes]HDW2141900.1 hypothetical protein [Klebsiella aerogenes]
MGYQLYTLNESGPNGLIALHRFVTDLDACGVRLSETGAFFELAELALDNPRHSALMFLREIFVQRRICSVAFYCPGGTAGVRMPALRLCLQRWALPPEDIHLVTACLEPAPDTDGEKKHA